MNQSDSVSRFVLQALLLVSLLLPAGISSCTASPQSREEAPSVTDTPEAAAAEREAPPEAFAETRPSPRSRDELVVVFPKSELELDTRNSYMATEAQVFTAIYEGLFSYHPLTMSPVPAAASRWELSEDRKEWTFFIRENADFENGDPLRAQDFRSAWLSLMEPERQAPYSSFFDIIEGARDFRLGRAGAERVGISAVDDKTLVVRLNSPAAFFPSMLCHHSFSPIHPSMLNGSRSRPVSNGPFFIEEINEDLLVLLKNHNYWDSDRVSLNKITVKFSDDPDEAAAMWNSGEARWINSNVNVNALTDRSGIEVNAMFATHYYYIRSARKPWDDFRLRRALSLVLPWEKIRENHFLPATTLIFPIPDYPEIEGLEDNDIEEAVRLMTEAGFPRGTGLPELVIRITPSQEASRIALLMAEAWYTLLGVQVKIDEVPFRDYFQSLKQNDHDVASITWIGDFADPFTFLKMWLNDSNLNDAGHNDIDFEELIEKSMNEEGLERWETLAEAETLLLSRGNVLPVSHHPALNIIDMNEIDGWFPNVLDIHPFKYLSIRIRRPLPGVVELPRKILQKNSAGFFADTRSNIPGS